MIRYANKFDMPTIRELLIEFFSASHHPLAEDIDKWSANHVDKVISSVLSGAGFILIDDKHRGMIVAIKQPSLWVPNVFILNEGMWYAKNSITATKLIKKYIEIAEDMKERGEIKQFYFNAYKDADFYKLGVRKISTCWGSYG